MGFIRMQKGPAQRDASPAPQHAVWVSSVGLGLGDVDSCLTLPVCVCVVLEIETRASLPLGYIHSLPQTFLFILRQSIINLNRLALRSL